MRYTWRGITISKLELSKSAREKYLRFGETLSINGWGPPVLCEKSGNGHYVFVPPEWGGDGTEFKITMELYANAPGIMKII